MKRFLTGLVLISFLVAVAGCGSSRRGVGCPNNPMNYRAR